MELHARDAVFWLDSTYEERAVPKEAGFLWHGGNCRPGCGACALGLGKVWWTRRKEAAAQLVEHADADARAALSDDAAAPPPPARSSPPVEIPDGNLHFAIVAALIHEKILPPLTGPRTRRSRPSWADDDDDYSIDEALARRLHAIPITADHLARLREITWPDAQEIRTELCPQWDGEDEIFHVSSLAGIERCTSLERLELDLCQVKSVAALSSLTRLRCVSLGYPSGVSDLRPLAGLPQLEEVSLSGARVTSLAPLVEMPRLKKVRIEWAHDARGAAGLRARSEAIVAELERRKVKLQIEFVKTRQEEQAEADALAAQKRLKDDARKLRRDGPAATPASDPAQEAQIAAAILSGGNTDEKLLVYADWLLSHGDPRGQLVTIDHQLADGKGDKALVAARKKVLKIHGAYLLARFVEWPYTDVAKLRWRAGFLHAALDFPAANTGVDSGVLLRELLALPTARFLEELSICNQFFDDGDGAAFKILAAAKPTPPLRALTITAGGFLGDSPESAEYGDLAKLARVYPGLRKLHLEGEPKLAGVDLPSLAELTIVSGGLPRAVVAGIAAAAWPSLERLTLIYGFATGVGVKELAPILDGTRVPRLTHLALRGVRFGDKLAAALARAPLVRRLETLDLFDSDMTDAGVAALLEASAAFAHLMLLDLRGCEADKAQRRALASLCTKVKL